jgi:two-component system, cell cycle sensor histidine kinase and response regulator CckA
VQKATRTVEEADELRKKAETKLQTEAITRASHELSARDAAKMLHELQVHQIELEMQNEELRRAQVELEESRRRYLNLFEFAPVGHLVLDEQGVILEVNHTLAKRLRIERHRLVHKPFLLNVAREDRDSFYLHLRRTAQSDQEQTCDIKLLTGDGTEYHVHLSSTTGKDSRGRLVHNISVTDISVRKRIEETLRESQQLLEKTFVSLADAVFVIGLPTHLILACNPSVERIFGYREDEMIGRTTECLHMDRARYAEFGARLLSALSANGVYHAEYQLRRKDGNGVAVELTATELLDDSNRRSGYVLAVRDITEKRRLEEELQRVKKLEAAEILAGGIAHDFNNLLGVILGNINLAQLEIQPESPASARLALAAEAVVLASDLTRQFLTISTGGNLLSEPCIVKQLLMNSASLVLRGTHVQCEYLIPDGLWLVEMDASQMGLAMQNVLINAREAMPEGGVIEITAENVLVGSRGEAAGPLMEEGPYVKIDIKDHGIGIPEENLPKIFDPYFSTKERGADKGMGLSLTATHSIIQKHHGYIKVDSKPGSGTVFHIYLPACEKNAAGAVGRTQ